MGLNILNPFFYHPILTQVRTGHQGFIQRITNGDTLRCVRCGYLSDTRFYLLIPAQHWSGLRSMNRGHRSGPQLGCGWTPHLERGRVQWNWKTCRTSASEVHDLSLSRSFPRRFAFSLLFLCCWIGLTGNACTLTQCSSILEKFGHFLFSAEQRVSKLLCFLWEDRGIGFSTAKENYRSRVFGNSQFVS